MKGLVKTFVLGSALSALASADFAYGDNTLLCDQPECQFKESIKTLQTRVFDGRCASNPNGTAQNMICHKSKGITCVPAEYIADQWSCSCTNWSTKKRSASIDVYCAN